MLRSSMIVSSDGALIATLEPAYKQKAGPLARSRSLCPSGKNDQFLVLSTSAFSLIQGIMARSFSPTASIW